MGLVFLLLLVGQAITPRTAMTQLNAFGMESNSCRSACLGCLRLLATKFDWFWAFYAVGQ